MAAIDDAIQATAANARTLLNTAARINVGLHARGGRQTLRYAMTDVLAWLHAHQQTWDDFDTGQRLVDALYDALYEIRTTQRYEDHSMVMMQARYAVRHDDRRAVDTLRETGYTQDTVRAALLVAVMEYAYEQQ